jgi:hypothetical protein
MSTQPFNSDGGFSTTANVATGNVTLSSGGVIYETAIPGGTLSGSTIALTPAGGTNADQQLLIYPTAGNTDANHLHLTSGNLYNTELFLGNDNLYVKLANTGNIVINSNDGGGNTAQWTFATNGNLTTPGSSGDITGANLISAVAFSSTGNITAGNVLVTGNIGPSATASPAPSINGFNSVNVVTVSTTGNIYTPRIQNGSTGITMDSGYPGYINFFNGTGTTITVGDDGNISATGNVTGANVLTGGLISATGNTNTLNLITRNGDPNPFNTRAQITLGYNGTTDYPQFVHTIHNAGTAVNNKVEFWTSDGTQAGTFPANAILGGSITQGAMQLAVYASTAARDSVITTPAPGMMIYVTGTGMQVRGATSWNTIAGSGS